MESHREPKWCCVSSLTKIVTFFAVPFWSITTPSQWLSGTLPQSGGNVFTAETRRTLRKRGERHNHKGFLLSLSSLRFLRVLRVSAVKKTLTHSHQTSYRRASIDPSQTATYPSITLETTLSIPAQISPSRTDV